MQNNDLSKKEIKKGLKNSIKDGIYTNAMGGLTDTYTIPYALALGANNAEVGLLNSIPKFFNTIVQPLGGKYVDRKKIKKKINNNFTLISRLLWIPVLLIPFIFSNFQVVWLIVLLSLSQVAAGIASTAWTSWIADLVPEKIRGKFFGRRNMLSSAAAFATTLIGGWLLGFYSTFIGFAIIFGLATLFGLISLYYLGKMPETYSEQYIHKEHDVSLETFSFLKEYRKYRYFSIFTIHMTLLTLAVSIASPFFIVYMLENLNIGYQWYAIATAAGVIAAMIMQQYWGKLADKFGDRTIMVLCNSIIIFYPFLFLFVTDAYGVVLISIFSGLAWSGFDLTSFNYLLDVTPPFKRPIYIGNFKLLTGFAAVLGPLIGGLLAEALSKSTIFIWGGLQIIFLLSFVLRGIFSALLLPKTGEVRLKATKVLPVSHVFWKAVAVYPIRGVYHELNYVQYCVGCWERKVGKKVKQWIG